MEKSFKSFLSMQRVNNCLIIHARYSNLSIKGHYLIIRMLHHICEVHNTSKFLDLYHAINNYIRFTLKWLTND